MKYVIFFTFVYNYKFSTPRFMLDENIYFIMNTIILLLTIFAIKSYKYYDIKLIIIILINLLLEILYNIFIFIITSPFLIFSSKLMQFVFSIHLNEIIYLNKKSAKLFMPYILWNFILTLFSIMILFLNC